MTPRVLSISAVTLATQDMARAVRFYRALGFAQAYGGETAAFTSFRVGQGHVDLGFRLSESRLRRSSN